MASLIYYRKALVIDREMDHKKGMSASYTGIGNVLTDGGEYEEALSYYARSLEIDRDTGDRKGVASCYRNVGIVHALKGSVYLAREQWELAIRLRRDMGLSTDELEEMIRTLPST